jgi:hypothetical protein
MPNSTCSDTGTCRCSCQPCPNLITTYPVHVTRLRHNEADPDWPAHIGLQGHAASLAQIESQSAEVQAAEQEPPVQTRSKCEDTEEAKTKSNHYNSSPNKNSEKNNENEKPKPILPSAPLLTPTQLHTSSRGSTAYPQNWTR